MQLDRELEQPASGQPSDSAGARDGILLSLASLRLTLFSLALLLVAVTFVYDGEGEAAATLPLIPPLSLLAINLLAAILTNGAFRRQMPLLLFHLSLLAIIVLVTLGRLTYLRATSEVITGGEHLVLNRVVAGPWHRGAQDTIKFENLGFSINYKPGLRRDVTLNRVRWRDDAGIPRTMEIGDQVPLVINGYRFYTSSNKGFAALFRWEPRQGEVELGTVNFPSYPSEKDNQTAFWKLGNDDLKVVLNIRETLIDPDTHSRFQMPARHDLTLDFGWRVATLLPGESVITPTGRLAYVGLTTWMGYNVFYDWTMSWLLAACALAVLALSWHFWRKFAQRPWQDG